MQTHSPLRAALAVASLLILMPVANAATTEMQQRQAGVDARYKSDMEACDTRAGNAKDVCVEEGKARQKVANAELQAVSTGKSADQNKLLIVRAETAYAVAKERCDDQAGNAKDVCVEQAKAVETKALADAKLSKQVGEARMDADADKRDADYKVAAEKCDALAGDAKSACMAAAKSRFGKS